MSCGEQDARHGRSLDFQGVILENDRLEERTHGRIELALFERVGHGFLRQRVGLDHREPAAGVPIGRVRLLVVVVVGRRTPNALARHEQIVPNVGVEFVKTVHIATVVVKLHGEEGMKMKIIRRGLERPRGMVDLHEEPVRRETVDHVLHVLIGTNVVLGAVVRLLADEIFPRVARAVTRNRGLPRFFREEIDMVAGAEMRIRVTDFFDVVFHGEHGEKILVVELGMVDQNVVVAVRHNAVSVLPIKRLDLGGGHLSVRAGSVAMQICLEMVSFFCNILDFHFFSFRRRADVFIFILAETAEKSKDFLTKKSFFSYFFRFFEKTLDRRGKIVYNFKVTFGLSRGTVGRNVIGTAKGGKTEWQKSE